MADKCSANERNCDINFLQNVFKIFVLFFQSLNIWNNAQEMEMNSVPNSMLNRIQKKKKITILEVF